LIQVNKTARFSVDPGQRIVAQTCHNQIMSNTTDADDMQTCSVAGNQSAIIAALGDPTSYSPTVDRVDRLDTHGALIFLAGTRAYKLKRAIKLPYMDFSTLSKREAACRNEIARNMGAASEIYIGVEPVHLNSDGIVQIGGSAPPHDWVVVMNRFAQDELLDNIAIANKLDKAHMPALATTIAHYHSQATVHRNGTETGDQIMARVIAQTTQSFDAHSDLIDRNRIDALNTRLHEELHAQSHLLHSRSRAGCVRLCHGDLHLKNIVLSQGRATLFDAIEFDDSIATIDVLYDIAFLLMDLWHRDLRAHANCCFNTYVARAMETEHLDGLAALPLFLATRAAVRAMIAIDRLAVASVETGDEARQEIAEYFTLAETFLDRQKPTLIAVGGLSGTGKTTLAAALAPNITGPLGALHLRSDVERKLMAGIDPQQPLDAASYTQEQSQKVYRRLAERAATALKAGQSVIVDAVFLEPDHRHAIEQIAIQHGRLFCGLWLEAQVGQLIQRVTNRHDDASDADASVVLKQLPKSSNPTTWNRIQTGVAPEVVLEHAAHLLNQTLGDDARVKPPIIGKSDNHVS